MLERTWEVDESNTVKTRFGWFGKKVVTVNGAEVYNARRMKRKNEILFHLPDRRPAVIQIKPEFLGTDIGLWVGGTHMIETPKKPIKCASCAAEAKPYDRFCGKCGRAMPTAEDHQNHKKVREATNAVRILAAMFLVFGLLMYLATKGQAETAIAKLGLERMDQAAVIPQEINGRRWTAGELLKQLEWEPWGVLIVNGILAAAMTALSFWAKRSPLPAVLAATATYAVVLVGNAIADPATLGQGIVFKIIIIAFLIKGIRAALSLRAARPLAPAKADA